MFKNFFNVIFVVILLILLYCLVTYCYDFWQHNKNKLAKENYLHLLANPSSVYFTQDKYNTLNSKMPLDNYSQEKIYYYSDVAIQKELNRRSRDHEITQKRISESERNRSRIPLNHYSNKTDLFYSKLKQNSHKDMILEGIMKDKKYFDKIDNRMHIPEKTTASICTVVEL